MREIAYLPVADVNSAIAALSAHENAMLLAGGTNVVDYLRAGVISPSVLIDISAVPLTEVHAGEAGFTVGGLARMSDVAADPGMRAFFPVVSQALELSASAQLRNMATIGGNLMQRTRCGYFREPGFACNKRAPGSGCAARDGLNRLHAVLGGSGHCVATHPSDLAVALVALDAAVHLQGPAGARQVPLTGFYRMPGDTPHLESELQPGEMIVEISAAGVPGASGSRYLKVRERASYEFAVVSVAAVVHAPGGVIETARIAFGGVGTVPWRDRAAENALTGVSAADAESLRSAADAARQQAGTVQWGVWWPEGFGCPCSVEGEGGVPADRRCPRRALISRFWAGRPRGSCPADQVGSLWSRPMAPSVLPVTLDCQPVTSGRSAHAAPME